MAPGRARERHTGMNGSDAEGRALVDADAHVSFRHELLRKGIHLSSLSIPVIYYFISRDLALALLIPVTALFLIGLACIAAVTTSGLEAYDDTLLSVHMVQHMVL